MWLNDVKKQFHFITIHFFFFFEEGNSDNLRANAKGFLPALVVTGNVGLHSVDLRLGNFVEVVAAPVVEQLLCRFALGVEPNEFDEMHKIVRFKHRVTSNNVLKQLLITYLGMWSRWM